MVQFLDFASIPAPADCGICPMSARNPTPSVYRVRASTSKGDVCARNDVGKSNRQNIGQRRRAFQSAKGGGRRGGGWQGKRESGAACRSKNGTGTSKGIRKERRGSRGSVFLRRMRVRPEM